MDINIKIVNSTQQEEGSGIIVATIVNQNIDTRTISYTCDYTYEELSTLIQSKEVYFKGDKMENMESDRLYQGEYFIVGLNNFILINIENNYEIVITDEGIEVNYRDDTQIVL